MKNMQLCFTNENGDRVQLFFSKRPTNYIARFQEAETVFLQGIKKLAQPIDRLKRKYEAFQKLTLQCNLETDFSVSQQIKDKKPILREKESSDPRRKTFKVNKQHQPPGNEEILVYQDNGLEVEPNPLPGGGFWTDLGSKVSRTKENIVLSEQWQGITLLQNQALTLAPSDEPIHVYSDQVSELQIIEPPFIFRHMLG
jgi:hypothetical protein